MAALLARIILALRIAARAPGLRLGIFAVVALAAAWLPLSRAGMMNDFRDAHILQTYEEVGARTIREYGQAPLWNPYSCGGMYAIGSPQTRVSSPTVLLSVVLGARKAESLLVFVFLLLGMEGAFQYLRRRVWASLGAFLAAPLFALNGYFAMSWSLGWVNFFGFELLPWVMLGASLIARGRVRGLVHLTAGFALMIAFGGTYPVPFAGLFVAIEALRSLGDRHLRRDRKRLAAAVGLLIAAGAVTAAACAFRLWPLVETMASAPRVMAGKPSHNVVAILQMAFAVAPRGGGNAYGLFYLGPAAAVLALSGLLSRRAIVPAVLALLLGWAATGYATGYSPFVALRALPVFETLRYPERLLIPAALFVCEVAAVGLAALVWRTRRWRQARWAVLAMCAVALVGWGVSVANFYRLSLRVESVPMPERVEQPFAQARGNRWVQGHFVALNRGSINCMEAYPVPMSERLMGNLPQEEYLEDPSAGIASRASWSPNRIEVAVDLTRPTLLIVNQNWHPGWRSDVGEVVSHDGLIAVRLPEGKHLVELSFLPRSAAAGAIVSLWAFAGVAWLAWKGRRSGRVKLLPLAIVAVVPLVAWATLAGTWPEPKQAPVLRNPDGTPLLVDVPPRDAQAVGVTFESGDIDLVGSRIAAAPDADGVVDMELYWRVRGKPPRSLGIFVHLVGPDGSFKNADHEVIGGTWFFKNAPKGRLLRDAFGANASEYKAGTWNVYVGLWHASGDHSRVAIRDAEGRPLPDTRVLVGSFVVPPKPEADAGTPDAGHGG